MSEASTALSRGRPSPWPSGWGAALARPFLLLAVCALPLLLYLPLLNEPLERDEGAYATVAQGLLRGQVPYRDLFDHKGPLVYGWYALSFLLLGEQLAAPRLLAALALSATALLVYWQARTLFSRPLAYLAATAFAAAAGIAWLQPNANSEAFMLLPLTASLLCCSHALGRGGGRWWALGGALAALALLTKQAALWNLLALLLFSLAWGWRRAGGLGQRLAPGLAYLGGAGAALGLVVAPFALLGALDDFAYANVHYNWLYLGQQAADERLESLGRGLLMALMALGPLAAGGAVGLLRLWREGQGPRGAVLLLWALASALGVASGGRFFPHYLLQALPALSLLLAAAAAPRGSLGASRRPWQMAALAVGATVTITALATNLPVYLQPPVEERHMVKYPTVQAQWQADSRLLGAYLAERTAPDETIYNLGRETQLYFYADRQPAARYIYDRPLWLDEGALEEVLADLAQAPPAYIVDTLQPPLFAQWEEFHPPALMAFLEENYDYVGRVLFADVYRLKGRPSPTEGGS